MKATHQRLARRIHLALCNTLITNPELFRGKTRTFIVISFSLQRNYTETISFIALFQYNVWNNIILMLGEGFFICWMDYVVKVKTCRQSKDSDSKFAQEKDAKGNLRPTIYVHEQD